MKTLVICSGGLDSVTLAYRVAHAGHLDSLISFDYGQRHNIELEFARRCASDLGVSHQVIDLKPLGQVLSGSALTDDIDVPHGHYEADSMRLTVVPNRNPIMMAIAFGAAAAKQLDAVALAVHGGDHFIYPDCRPEFIAQFAAMEKQALEGVAEIELQAPFVHWHKSDIAAEGSRLGVPFERTWSCYEGGEHHCGRCGTCVERREAMATANVPDPTTYLDADFWQQAVQQHVSDKG